MKMDKRFKITIFSYDLSSNTFHFNRKRKKEGDVECDRIGEGKMWLCIIAKYNLPISTNCFNLFIAVGFIILTMLWHTAYSMSLDVGLLVSNACNIGF